MTCIIGIRTKNHVFMGCDSALCEANGSLLTTAESKIFKVNENILIGCAGASGTTLGVIRHCWNELPPRQEGQKVREYVIKVIRERIKQSLKEDDQIKEGEMNGVLMIGCYGKLFVLESDFGLVQVKDKWDCIGSGRDTARGTLEATKEYKPKERILKALQATEKYNNDVRSPFEIKKINNPPQFTETEKVLGVVSEEPTIYVVGNPK